MEAKYLRPASKWIGQHYGTCASAVLARGGLVGHAPARRVLSSVSRAPIFIAGGFDPKTAVERVLRDAVAAKHVVVVDDDPAIREMIVDYLKDSGFQVTAASDGGAMTQVVNDGPKDLVILDLKLEREDGLDLLRHLREHSDVPVIVITGHRRDETDRVVGLELGADDYITKPFGLRELAARVRAVLRRSEATERRTRSENRRARYRFADWELSTKTRQLTSPMGESVSLTAGEFNLLTAFLRAPRQVLSRDQLLLASRLHDQEVFDRSIDVQILRLRRKLEINPNAPKLIVTERGAGYIFAASVDIL